MKLIALLNSLVLIFVLTSCGDNKPERSSKTDKNTDPSISSGNAFFLYFIKVSALNAQFKHADCFEGGYARVKLNSGASAFIDTNGTTVCTFSNDR